MKEKEFAVRQSTLPELTDRAYRQGRRVGIGYGIIIGTVCCTLLFALAFWVGVK